LPCKNYGGARWLPDGAGVAGRISGGEGKQPQIFKQRLVGHLETQVNKVRLLLAQRMANNTVGAGWHRTVQKLGKP
jgi:hypothetical protein